MSNFNIGDEVYYNGGDTSDDNGYYIITSCYLDGYNKPGYELDYRHMVGEEFIISALAVDIETGA